MVGKRHSKIDSLDVSHISEDFILYIKISMLFVISLFQVLSLVENIINESWTKANGVTIDEIREEEYYEEFTKRDVPFLKRLEDNGLAL